MSEAVETGAEPSATPSSAATPPRKKKEGWVGILLTAAVCGTFLHFWFSPEKLDPVQERHPLTWVRRAVLEPAGTPDDRVAVDYDLMCLALISREVGDASGADEMAKLIETPALRQPAAARTRREPAPWPEDRQPPEVRAAIQAALTAYDQLEYDQGREILLRLAAGTTEPAAADAEVKKKRLAGVVAAIFLRLGLPDDAREALRSAGATAEVPELADTDVVAPLLPLMGNPAAWAAGATVDPAELAAHLAATIVARWRNRENTDLSVLGSRSGAGFPGPAAAEPLRHSIWSAVEANQMARAQQLAEKSPAGPERAGAYLTLARALLWHLPAPVQAPGADLPTVEPAPGAR